ncbi:hypothetical protein BDV19DRAFT_391458 [Aspergillus venezuelensis]
MPLAHYVTPLQYAMCALGAAHRRFLLSGAEANDQLLCKKHYTGSEITAIEMYNVAIVQLRTHVSRGALDTPILAVCCIVFVCIENLLGRYTDSVRHLRAGGSLLSQSQLAGASYYSSMKQAMLPVYYQLGHDTVIYHGFGGIMLEGLSSCPDCTLEVPDMGSGHEPFASYDDASIALRRLDVIYDACFGSSVSVGPGVPVSDLDRERAALRSARAAFNIWDQRFRLLELHQPRQSASHASDHLINLTLQRSIWALLTSLESFNEPLDTSGCNDVLTYVQTMLGLSTSSSQNHPTFTLGGDLVPVLALICALCENRETCLRGVAVLRSLRRREGMWDSREIAEGCDAMIRACGGPESLKSPVGKFGCRSIQFPRGLRRWWLHG